MDYLINQCGNNHRITSNLCHFHYSSYPCEYQSLVFLVKHGNSKQKEIIRICMLYNSFPWDCSSIGQSTALSRRKLRVRAPSVPTQNPMNPSIHLSIFCEEGGGKGAEFYSQRWTLFLSFFVSHFSSDKYGNFNYFNQYRLMGERHMQIENGSVVSSYLGFQERHWSGFFDCS